MSLGRNMSTTLDTTSMCEYAAEWFMARILRQVNQDMPTAMRILEVNPDHPMVKTLERLHSAGHPSPLLSVQYRMPGALARIRLATSALECHRRTASARWILSVCRRSVSTSYVISPRRVYARL